ncbi:NAD(+)/NADH kinase [Desulfofundulus thermocisternus]|jgi:NAD+ kinase|uniref:NAD(+)/NADH kinase n=1 Tax=Desulfofundulus thermocisternus TaxID=42471 RepID=UPI001A0EF9BD|nr:NAD(+)/NADH kinase [Desulfofundulus thermocisternus]MBE3584679.1 NAD(+)/NADH kinase [Thermoanaerobacter sp.]MCS5694774.1 NAD(+)/NADH kinase [Desulfofundulus thermocisternus]
MRNIGLVVNLGKQEVAPLVEQIIDWLTARGCRVVMAHDTASALGHSEMGLPREQLVQIAEVMLVLGGDGTLLRCAREAAPRGIPLLGINFGHLGFLTEIDAPELWPGLEKLLAGRYSVEERMMLEARVLRGGQMVQQVTGLNDAVITKGAFARLIFLETYVDEQLVTTYPADGLIVATPTGSTAYSLSAGGPLVTPELDLMVVTPICPHSLWARPLVIKATSQVKVIIRSKLGEVMLTVDGQQGYKLEFNDMVLIRQSAHRARLIRLKKRSFFYLLRQKLSEGERLNDF